MFESYFCPLLVTTKSMVTNNRFKIQWLILKILVKYLYFWNECQLLDFEPMGQWAFHAHWWVQHDDYLCILSITLIVWHDLWNLFSVNAISVGTRIQGI